MRPRTIGPKLLIIAATALAITIAGSAEAEHDHGGEGWDGGDRHEGRGWRTPELGTHYRVKLKILERDRAARATDFA